MARQLSAGACKRRLAVLWLGAGLVLFLVLVVQSMFGKFGDEAREAWAWFGATLMPTLSLIVGILVLDAASGKKEAKEGKKVDRFFFGLAFGLSAVYLLCVYATVFLQPLTFLRPGAAGASLTELMRQSGLWLGPLQGLVSASLGIFFVKSERGS